jgi:hypothetical protein
MSGVMEKSARTRALRSLRMEAERVSQEVVSEKLADETLASSYGALRVAWRSFPECKDDIRLPRVADILAAVTKADAIDLFEKRNSFRDENRWLENQKSFLSE